ncbi:MAG: RNA polymerase sigma factor [Planctomycetota bacterium]
MDDTTLIRRCLRGNAEAYGALVDRYSARILSLAFAMTGDRHEAEDIAQDTFVRAYKGLARFRHKAKFSSWLYQIALNLCRDRLKSKGRQVRRVEDEELAALSPDPAHPAPRALVEEEFSRRTQEAIAALPVLYREAFVLRHLAGKEYAEIARILGIPAQTARVRAYRAREMLRESLAPNVDTFWREKAAREKVKAGAAQEATS